MKFSGILWYLIVLAIAFCSLLSSCFEESYNSDYSGPIHFSRDTLRFDTVFTTVGSVTREIKIINPSNENIVLKSISLQDPAASFFRLNVDGVPGKEFTDIRIPSRDSIYLFVEATIDPNQALSVSPFVIEDKIRIKLGGGDKDIVLEAWGQNANYFTGKDAQGKLLKLSCGGGQLSWNDLKPYVIHGLLFIDSCTLKIPAGRKIYFHGGLARLGDDFFNDGGLFLLPDGRLEVEGSAQNRVSFQGDRLEQEYSDIPGQWAGIRLLPGSSASLSYANIKNSIVGIRADSSSSLHLNSVQIFNTANAGLVGIHSDIQADNCLIHSNETQSVALVYGGHYNFRYCTFANFENGDPAVYADNLNCLNADCSQTAKNRLDARFINCIISGSNSDELIVRDISEGQDPSLFGLRFDHSLLRIDESKKLFNFPSSCISCIEHVNEELFINESIDNYFLDTLSLARNKGIVLPDLDIDLLGNKRKLSQTDLGCFSFRD